ncbi:MAG: YceI family protein [Acidobacteria bacterium]|nr:MAG: YceI family protein [Acidobacteriota bacterium]
MGRRWIPVAAASILAGYVPGPAGGEALRFEVDPEASRIEFVLQATAHKVRGTMRVAGGSVEADLDSGRLAGEIVVDAASAETGNRRRDRKMHERVLESRRFPRIRLLPRRLEGPVRWESPFEADLSALLELHGLRHAVEIPLRVLLTPGRLEADASFDVPYVAWGLEDPSFLLLRVAKKVHVKVHLVAAGPVARSPVPAGED